MPASDATTLEHDLKTATHDGTSVDNADGKFTLEELLDEDEGLLDDFLLFYFEAEDRMTPSVHPVIRAALMEERAATREEDHKDWTIRRDSFFARGEAFIRSKKNTAQKNSTNENRAVGLLKEYLLMKTIVL